MAKIKEITICWNPTIEKRIIAVVGSRTIDCIDIVFDQLDLIGKIDQIVSGGAKGADTLAELYARSHDIELVVIQPEWNKYGKSAGFLRNGLIADKCTHIVCFWDGKSKGATDTLRKAMDQNKGWKLIEIEL